MEEQQKSGHLVLVMAPFQGHLTPMLQLATILHSKGFSITIVHPELNSLNPSNHPEFTFVSIPDKIKESQLSDEDLADKLKESLVSNVDVAGSLQSLHKNCAAPLQKCLENILHSHHHIAAVIYDTLMFCAQTIVNELGIPGITLRTTSATTMLLFSVLPQLGEKELMSGIESPELQALQLQRLRALIVQNPTQAMMEVRAAFTNAIKFSSAIIVNSMEFLELEALSKVRQYFPTPIFTVGPLHKLAPAICCSLLTEDDKCISWLNKQAPKSVIYVSFGSIAIIDKQELIETAWGLSNSKQPFLWVVRPGMVCGSEWIESLPNGFEESVGERGCIVKWAPQKEVLAHAAVGGFWSHCGWNSTIESICEGVPMLCRPFFGDQLLNSNYICNVWKIGLELQNLERGNTVRTIKRLMVDMEGKDMRKRAMDLKKKAALRLMEDGSTSCSFNGLIKQISV
ncbi:UDP-glucose iridoid glucosyltransferase-like isoform X1 [Gossypium raimondii]|uniref:UDP-glucose iridoid glucosyltransferase-like isoform X1 n=1 Tax=Gossypium raimondii TaxID=29730 RepID=UPI00227D36FF|nr:UDP-glucose iridoid glucosyltransferase-like isoform X1 [Gossypium raimondii]